MKSNALRYDDRHFSQFGRSPRECIPCKERELFISESARKGDTTVTLRQKNRYIDEFLGFINDTYGFSEPQQLTAEHIIAFEKALSEDKRIKKSTRNIKLTKAKQWLKWLHSNQHIKQLLV